MVNDKLEEKRKHGNFLLPLGIYDVDLGDKEYSISAHWHKEIEIILVNTGEFNLQINSDFYTCKCGDLVIINCEELHYLIAKENVYSEFTSLVFDISQLNSSILDSSSVNFITPIINKKFKLPTIINENSIYIDNMNKKITKEETEQLDKFADKFIKLFAGKTDYEKIYMAYVYISRNAVYQSDGVFENLVDGYISAYDVLINNKTVCIGSATAFSYLMDKLGIESYIVDHIASYDAKNRIYYSSHTYNVVKLDGKYYIVDIKYNNDLSGLLISNQNYKDEKYNYNILISDEDYPRENFDYTFNENDINNLENEIKEETKLESDESIYYIILVLILLVIGLIIFIFTRRKK